MSDKIDTVVVVSGGLDSAVALGLYHSIGRQVLAVSVNYGQRHARELGAAVDLANFYSVRHEILAVPGLAVALPGCALTDPNTPVPEGHYAAPSMASTVVPGRNAILTTLAASVAIAHQAKEIVLGVHAGDHPVYPDCRPVFVSAVDRVVACSVDDPAPPQVVAPFMRWSKTEIVSLGYRLGVPFARTWSCYQGGDRHCGRCGTCVERAEAFREAVIPDPTVYETTPTATGPEKDGYLR